MEHIISIELRTQHRTQYNPCMYMSTCQMEHGTWHGTCQLMRQVKWSGKCTHNSLFNYFQVCLGFFRQTDGYSALSSGGLPCPFMKVEKNTLILEKDPACILKSMQEKNYKMFPYGTLFLAFLTRYLSKRPSSTKLLLPWKVLIVQLLSSTILFVKRSILSVSQCSEYISVLITAQ